MVTQSEISGHGRTIAVFGASGHTGRFMVAELLRRGFAPLAIGRDSAKLAKSGFQQVDVPIRTASIDDPASLDRSLAAAAAVINCAGPFLDTADAVAAAALRARIHYLDVTAEQPSAQAIFDRFGEAATEAGVVVIPAMGFYGGFADLLATAAMGNWDSADEIRPGIALDSWRPTQGTRITGQRNTARRLVMEDGTFVPVAQPATQTFWDFPEPFGRQDVIEMPFSEVPVIARHLRVARLRTYLNNTPLRDLRDSTTPPPIAADERGRSSQTFLVDVVVRNGSNIHRAIAQGRDIYAFTAPLVVEAVKRILDGRARGTGALAPGEAFDSTDFLRALAPEYLTFELSAD
ncbi:MAG TPA: saccharopine dehydrogenase NADP-binding domain-containing protein [Acidobacteriaceae bacterium]